MNLFVRKGQPVFVDFLEDQGWIPMHFIGCGRHAAAYHDDMRDGATGDVFQVLRNHDPCKEILYRVNHESEVPNPHVPVLNYWHHERFYIYSMPFYDMLTAKNKEPWRQFNRLKELFGASFWDTELTAMRLSRRITLCEFYRRMNENFAAAVEEADYLPETLKDAVSKINMWAADFGGEAGFEEPCKRNYATKDGLLILLDPIMQYDTDQRRYKT